MTGRLKKIKKIITPFLDKCERDNITAIAGQCAFFLILTFFPLAMFSISVLRNFNISVDTFENILDEVLNDKASEYISEIIGSVSENSSGISVITLLVTLWTSAQGIHIITNGLNRIHETYEDRIWILLRLKSVLLTILFFAIIILTVLIIILGTSLNNFLMPYIRCLPGIAGIIYDLRYLLFYIYLSFLFALLYSHAPNIDKEKKHEYGIKSQFPGAIFCSSAWLLLSLGISVYVDDFQGFSIYGSLTKLAILMIWIYMCIICLMIGAEINVIYHNQIMNFSFRKKHYNNTKKKTLT